MRPRPRARQRAQRDTIAQSAPGGGVTARGSVRSAVVSDVRASSPGRSRAAPPDPSGDRPQGAPVTPRRCSGPRCKQPAVYTLTYVYRDSTAVLGPLAAYVEPHCYDLCAAHADRLTAPRGWEVVRLPVDPAAGRGATTWRRWPTRSGRPALPRRRRAGGPGRRGRPARPPAGAALRAGRPGPDPLAAVGSPVSRHRTKSWARRRRPRHCSVGNQARPGMTGQLQAREADAQWATTRRSSRPTTSAASSRMSSTSRSRSRWAPRSPG